MASSTTMPAIYVPPLQEANLLALPAEIRIHILEYVFDDNLTYDGFQDHGLSGGISVDEDYNANDHLQPLLACKQLYQDGNLLALKRTTFVVSNLFANIPDRISTLHPKQIQSIRSIAVVADHRHFRKLPTWGSHPFGLQSLHLTTLTIVLHRSSFWHYLFDFTSDLAKLLRSLQGVQRLVFVRNAARVKGSFKTWYNRLIGLMLKMDHHERYLVQPPNLERSWWGWSYDELAQSFALERLPPKVLVDEETYLRQMMPLLEELRQSIETEEWNPDPRARNHYY